MPAIDHTGDTPGERNPSLVDSRIRVIEETPDRLLIHIPAGGQRATHLGRMLLIVGALLSWALVAWWVGPLPRPPLFPPFEKKPKVYLALGGFLGLLVYWLVVRFERTTILLERDHLALQRSLFGFRWIEQVSLSDQSRAVLEEYNHEKRTPQHRVSVSGENSSVKFGATLQEEEKVWLVLRMNEFLGGLLPIPQFAGDRSEAIISSASSSRQQRLLPLPLCQSGIKVVEASDECLSLYIPGGGPQARLPRRAALIWSAIPLMAAITFWVLALDSGGPREILWTSVFFVGCLSLFGVGVWRWIRARFPETFFHLDRQRAILKRSIFHLRWVNEVVVTPESSAEVVVAYEEQAGYYEMRQICQVVFQGQDSVLKFGLPLAQLEKEWLVDQINVFLHRA